MFRVHSSIAINRPLAVVWRALIDFPGVPSWERGVVAMRQTSPGAPGVGTTFAVRRVYFGRATRIECRITEWDDAHGVTMALRGGPLLRASVRYAVESASDERTVVTYTGEGELIAALRLLTPLMPTLGRSDERRNLANLKRLLEGSG